MSIDLVIVSLNKIKLWHIKAVCTYKYIYMIDKKDILNLLNIKQ